ncbi:MAG TPA: LLM class F420-dependent oxidoreductase [bacterium]|nr:LLM class F420-dependent oxidoreductase [bacterium]
MEYGIMMFPSDFSMPPGDFARAVEERGFESVLFPEHTHIPASRKTPFPAGGELPQIYSHGMDPFVALTAAAVATTRLRIGTGVCLVVERDPITLAKQVASLDLVSGGRFLFGIGGGWNREEMEDHGTDYATRWTLLRERVEAMQAIWTQDEATYHGQFVNFDRIWSWPKPVQKPHPPILVGGNGARTLQRVVRYGDEWMPIARPGLTFGDRIKELQDLSAKAGRGPIPVSMFYLSSTPKSVEEHQREGVSRLVMAVNSAGADEVLPRLDRLAALVRRFEGN